MSRSTTSWWARAVQNRLILLVLAMVIAIPFIATPTDINHNGVAAVFCEGFGILLLIALLWRARPNFSKESLGAFFKTAGNLPALIFMGLVGVSCALSPHKAFSAQEAMRLGTGILVYFVVAYQFRRSEHITKLLDLLVWVAIGVSLVGCIQFGASPDEQQYAVGLFGDHQLYGSFLMLLLPVVCVAALTEKNSNKQLVAQIGAVLTIVALLLSHARSAWIGAAVGLAALGVIALISASKRSKLGARKHEIVLPVMILVVSVGFFMLVSPQASSIIERAGTLSHAHTEKSVLYRAQMSQGALDMIADRPLTGQGVGMYALYQSKYGAHLGTPIFMLKDKSGNFARPSLGEQAHDLYLQTAAELGIPGLIVLIAIPILFLIMGLKRVTTMDAGIRRAVLLGAIGSTIAFLVDAAGSPAWQCGQISLFFWVILGMGVGSLRPRHKRFSADREEIDESAPAPVRGFLRVVSVFAGLALVLVMMQSVAYATAPIYLVPRSADIEPKDPTINSFQSQSFTLNVTFTNGQTFDETANSTFTAAGNPPGNPPQGTMNGNTYTAGIGPEIVTITGTFTQQSVTVSDATSLTVNRTF